MVGLSERAEGNGKCIPRKGSFPSKDGTKGTELFILCAAIQAWVGNPP